MPEFKARFDEAERRLTIDRRIELSADAFEEAEGRKPGEVEIVAYTGDAVKSWFGPIIVDLAGRKAGEKHPLLRQHNPEKALGVANSAEVVDNELLVRGQIAVKTSEGADVRELSRIGFEWQASIGFDVLRLEEIEDGVSVEVNGRVFEGPGRIVREWEHAETSLVIWGRDPATSATVFAEPERPAKGATMADKQNDNAASLAELRQRFSDDPAFVLEQLDAGATLAEADQAHKLRSEQREREKLSAELAAAQKQRAELEAQLAAERKRREELEQADQLGATPAQFSHTDEQAQDAGELADDKFCPEGFASAEDYLAFERAGLAGRINMSGF